MLVSWYLGRVWVVGEGGTEEVGAGDSQADISDGVEDLVEEDVVVVEEGGEEEVEDEVVAQVEVGLYVAHVI